MLKMMKFLAAVGALAGIAGAAPAIAQYNPANPAGAHAQIAAQQCTGAVQAQLTARGYGTVNEPGSARVLNVTRADAKRRYVHVRGTATSGVLAQGVVGAIGALGVAHAPPADLTFKCRIDYRGRILELDIDRLN